MSGRFRHALRGAEGETATFDLHLPEATGPSPLVVILHGFKGFRGWGFFPHLAERMAAKGIAALRLDFSHNGVGQGEEARDFTRLDLFRRNRPRYEMDDVARLLSCLRGEGSDALPSATRDQLDLSRLAFLGHSKGGPIAILTAAREGTPAVTWNGVASLAFREEHEQEFRREGVLRIPNSRTGQIMEIEADVHREMSPLPERWNLVPALERLGDQLLLVHGEGDTTVPIAQAEELSRDSKGQARLVRIPGANHVFGARHPFAGTTPALDEAIAASLRHLQERLDPAGG